MNDSVTSQKIIICLPTYNEAGNIRRIVQSILRVLPRASVLIIDDHSPDKTGAIAEGMALNDYRIRVLHRRDKEGLGRAYLEGFNVALHEYDAQYIVQMDADFSHPPDALPGMVRAMARADLVIGSRYVTGGATKNRCISRRAISRFGSLYARFWLCLPVLDPTGGFKVWRRKLLRSVMDHPIGSGGYVFQVETTYIAHRLGARLIEYPICFTDRRVGYSKMNPKIALEAFWRIPMMKNQRPSAVEKRKPVPYAA